VVQTLVADFRMSAFALLLSVVGCPSSSGQWSVAGSPLPRASRPYPVSFLIFHFEF
jgi:hypothetical protein